MLWIGCFLQVASGSCRSLSAIDQLCGFSSAVQMSESPSDRAVSASLNTFCEQTQAESVLLNLFLLSSPNYIKRRFGFTRCST